MIYKILHANHGNFFADELSINDYTHVASVQCQTLDDVFHITQNLYKNWTKNNGVLHSIGELRSTSVGDIIIEEGTGKMFMVENIGFREVKVKQGFYKKI